MENSCFVIGAWLDNKVKEENLVNLIKDLKSKNYPVCLVTHCIVSERVQSLVDYFIYEKKNVLSDDFKLTIWKMENEIKQEKQVDSFYHGVACLMNIRNSIDLLFAKGEYEYIHYIESDVVYDYDKYMNLFRNKVLSDSDAKALFVHYQDGQFRTDLFSVDISWFNQVVPRVQSWEEYKSKAHNDQYILEYWVTHYIQKTDIFHNKIILMDFEVGNKWTKSIDDIDWGDEIRQELNFEDAPIALSQSLPERYRKESFEKVLKCLYKSKNLNPNIVEIGVTRKVDSITDGDSTSIFAWYISNFGGSYYGCDIDPISLKAAEECLRRYIKETDKSVEVSLTEMDGLEFLKKYNKPIDLLYLDAIDYPAFDRKSEIFHLQLLLESIDKVKVNGYIMIDDVIDVNTFEGKGKLVIPYLLSNNNFTCIHRDYQFIFRKDI